MVGVRICSSPTRPVLSRFSPLEPIEVMELRYHGREARPERKTYACQWYRRHYLEASADLPERRSVAPADCHLACHGGARGGRRIAPIYRSPGAARSDERACGDNLLR